MENPRKSEHAEVRYEADTGFVCLTQIGRLEGADARMIIETMTAYHTQHIGLSEPLYMLIDIRQATSMSPEARKIFAESQKDLSAEQRSSDSQRRLAIFGGSFALRSFANLLMEAMRLASRAFGANADAGLAEWTVKVDEATARAWLTEERRVYLARKARM